MAELKKVLSFKVILLITINSIMGTGIFFLPALGAGKAGPASLLSWVIMGLISIYVSMCFAELTGMFPKAGGVYEFAKNAYGRFPSFMIGFTTLITANITIAMLIVGAIQYLLADNAPLITIPISLLFIFIFNFIAYRGMQTSSVMLVTFAIITLSSLFGLMIPGSLFIQKENLLPFFAFPVNAIFLTVFLIAETFFGWETSTFLAEETKDGAKVMPKALVYATIIIALISFAFTFITIGTIHWSEISLSAAPLADLSVKFYGANGSHFFTILVYLSIIGSVAGWIISSPRLILAMARDNLFIKLFGRVHPKYQTPHFAIALQTVFTSVLVIVGAGSYTKLLELLVPLVLLMYAAVIYSVFHLRRTQPDRERTYRAPFAEVGSLAVVVGVFALLGIWLYSGAHAVTIFFQGLSIVAFGIPVYLLLEMYYSPKTIEWINDIFAYPAYILENLYLPHKHRIFIIEKLGDLNGKKILEFGCNVGTLTEHLAVEVGKNGHVYATDFSGKKLSYAHDRTSHHKHVTTLHDSQHFTRVHPMVPKIDHVVSVATLSYVTDVENVLNDFNKRLKKNGKVVILEYDKFFFIIPNSPWISNKKELTKKFKNSGFDVDISHQQGVMWKYIFIEAVKVDELTQKKSSSKKSQSNNSKTSQRKKSFNTKKSKKR